MRAARIATYTALVAVVVIGGAAAYLTLRASLPQIDGEVSGAGLGAPATIARDAQGTPTIRAHSRRDLAFATGFAHAQDRFFQMDLMRRVAAGELAELLGPGVVDIDKKYRIHAFRRIAAEVVTNGTDADRELLTAYAAGVNLALARAHARPWEYTLLRTRPAPWQPEDSVLVAFSMYLNLNDSSGTEELTRSQLRAALPPALFAFLHPLGTEWDAPVTGGKLAAIPPPGPEVFDLRAGAARTAALSAPTSSSMLEEKPIVGSNSWAVAGSHAKDGAALLANDMHLALRLPHVWYRARLVVEPAATGRDLVGVTLPGLPILIAGSNGRVAWGYTNSYGDWTDDVIVEVDPQHADRYFVADGSEPFQVREETINVRGADPVTLTVKTTRWGPVVGQDAEHRPLALAWTAHEARATNLRMLDLEATSNVAEALAVANHAGGPVQNFLAVDSDGHIGWSLMGQVPIRGDYDTTVPTSWRMPGVGWIGWRAPDEYPRIIDPAAGRLWTANTRTIDLQTWLAFLGDGRYDLGARAAQIRDDLLKLSTASGADMTAIQLDDRALFLMRWRDLLTDVLAHAAPDDNHPLRRAAQQALGAWSGRASAGDVGYRIVRAARLQIRKDVFDSVTAAARARFPGAKFAPSEQFEAPLWQLVTQRPAHLLDPRYENWQAALLASVDRALESLQKACGQLTHCTWGAENTLQMRHPLSGALPFATHWLDMPATAMSGDSAMPRVQGRAFGASQRLVVSPGHEAQGYFQMPGGPVDHPLSPFYGAGHDAWVRGDPMPLLPGKPAHTLTLR